jgi:hypothetical protein
MFDDEPQSEDTANGVDPGSPVLTIDFSKDLVTAPGQWPTPEWTDEIGDEPSDQPNVIFEVPASITDAEVREILGNGPGDLEQIAQVRGIDAYAWYVSFHQRSRQYGIYMPFERILSFSIDILAHTRLPLERRLEVAFHAILRHEMFHFETDCMAANWELVTGEPVYWLGRDEPLHRELEEGLANAYMLRGVRHPKGVLRETRGCYKALSDFCTRQPPGYPAQTTLMAAEIFRSCFTA